MENEPSDSELISKNIKTDTEYNGLDGNTEAAEMENTSGEPNQAQLEALELVKRAEGTTPRQYTDAQKCLKIVQQYARGRADTLSWWQILWLLLRVSVSLRPGLMLALMVATAVSCLFSYTTPKSLQLFIDNFTTDKAEKDSYTTLLVYAIGNAMSRSLGWISSILPIYISSHIATCIGDVWGLAAFQHVLTLPMSFHHKHQAGLLSAKIERCTHSVECAISALMGSDCLGIVADVFAVFVVIMNTCPESIWIFLVPMPLIYLVTYSLRNLSDKTYEVMSPLFDVTDARRSDALGNILLLKLFDRDQAEAKYYASAVGVQRSLLTKGNVLDFTKQAAEELTRMIFIGILMVFCLIRLCDGRLTVGEVTVLLDAQRTCFSPVSTVARTISSLQATIYTIKPTILLLTEADPMEDKQDAIDLPNLRDGIQIRNVSFFYNDESKMATKNINLSIKKGTTALVGHSGGGKSTLATLLARLYDAKSGSITWDGIDLRDSTRSSRQKQIAVVPQDAALLNRSIMQNIRLARPEATDEEVMEAAKLASAHDFIVSNLPNGYETEVGERGTKLSGGQRQRINIARAILMKPSLLIMDESTANLDAESEHAILKSLESIEIPFKVIIAHRFSTIMNADQIVVIDNGEVVATGDHTSLLQTCPLYSKLYELQVGF